MKSKLAWLAMVAPMTLAACAPGRTDAPAGGGTASGGASASGGRSGGSGGNGAGGTESSGGASNQGGSVASGGSTASGEGGRGAAGGVLASGGKSGSGGATTAAGGASAAGGATAPGAGSGGSTGAGGTTASGSAGTGGTTASTGVPAGGGPCDIYEAAGTPCVAAHSTVRALYKAYTGALYQVRKSGSTKDIPVGSDGFVDISIQDTFCSGGGCTISVLYDQSPKKNDLVKSPKALWLPNGGDEAPAAPAGGKITVSGHTAYGIYVDNNGNNGVGYRNNATKGLATGDQPEAMYMVVDGKRYNQWCCFDYGNAETSGRDDGDATMEALYWGNSTQWTRGGGNGPWMAADLENGMFEGDSKNATSNTSISASWIFVVGMLKGPSGNTMGIKAGNAQSGKLETKWDGKRPPGYSPKKLNGAIILGTGGDGSNNAKGTFFEGAITSGNSSDATDDAVQANIVAAGYGK